MIRPIHPGLSPNVEAEDFLIAVKKLLLFWRYNQGNDSKNLEKWFEKEYQSRAFAFSSGRGALFAILSNLGIQKNDEILVTGFTCVAVVDAVLSIGARPIYVDIKKDFTMDSKDFKRKITKKVKACIIQHTFGISNATEEILKICKDSNVQIIEDVAHGIGLSDKKGLIGTKGIASLFSFGRDKAFSCVSGGIVITRDKKLSEKLQQFQHNQKESSSWWVFQNLFHIVSLYSVILPLYDFLNLGKVFLLLLQKLGFLARPIDTKELQHFSLYTNKLSSALSSVALSQLKREKRFNAIRQKHVEFYREKLRTYFPNILKVNQALLRFPLLVENPQILKRLARRKNIYLGDWYSNQIDPKGTDISALFYKKDSCPTAEYIAEHVVNLPTYPTLSVIDAQKVVTICIAYAQSSTNNK